MYAFTFFSKRMHEHAKLQTQPQNHVHTHHTLSHHPTHKKAS